MVPRSGAHVFKKMLKIGESAAKSHKNESRAGENGEDGEVT